MDQQKRLIAIADSDANHRGGIFNVLSTFYRIQPWDNAKDIRHQAKAYAPALLLLGSRLLSGNSIDVIRFFREDEILQHIPIVYVADSNADPLIGEARKAGAVAILKKPYPPGALIQTVSTNLNAAVERGWQSLPGVQREALQNSVGVFREIADVLMSGEPVAFNAVKDNCQPLVEAIENNDFKGILEGVRLHDDYTYAHSVNVATMLTLLGKAAGFNHDEQLLMAGGGLLHDVGKMTIPHEVLNKPGRLSEEEFAVMKTHVPETMKYLDTAGDIPNGVHIIAGQHHEKIDGTGYPHGLKGAELNELARMAAVVDVFSALTDRRVYKPPIAPTKAIEIMSEEMTSHLDQSYVKMFRGILGDSHVLD